MVKVAKEKSQEYGFDHGLASTTRQAKRAMHAGSTLLSFHWKPIGPKNCSFSYSSLLFSCGHRFCSKGERKTSLDEIKLKDREGSSWGINLGNITYRAPLFLMFLPQKNIKGMFCYSYRELKG
jgi:hypothetical protein